MDRQKQLVENCVVHGLVPAKNNGGLLEDVVLSVNKNQVEPLLIKVIEETLKQVFVYVERIETTPQQTKLQGGIKSLPIEDEVTLNKYTTFLESLMNMWFNIISFEFVP